MAKKRQNNVHGWVLVDKPTGMTSNQLLGKIKWLFGTKKAGFVGTLDPMASGVMPIALGEASKTISFIQNENKAYKFTMQFGVETDTLDAEGQVTAQSEVLPESENAIQKVLPSFLGEIAQMPPAFSAKKVGGQRAYDLARAGKEVTLQPAVVRIDALDLISYDASTGQAAFSVVCSKGTYVRSIARDIAAKLGTFAHVTVLRRTQHGKITEKDVFLLDLLEEMGQKGALQQALKPLDAMLDGIPVLSVEDNVDTAYVRHGNPIAVYCEDAKLVQLHIHSQLVALGMVRNQQFSPTRVFNL